MGWWYRSVPTTTLPVPAGHMSQPNNSAANVSILRMKREGTGLRFYDAARKLPERTPRSWIAPVLAAAAVLGGLQRAVPATIKTRAAGPESHPRCPGFDIAVAVPAGDATLQPSSPLLFPAFGHLPDADQHKFAIKRPEEGGWSSAAAGKGNYSSLYQHHRLIFKAG
ncbi:hypothetical protein CCM_03091 [Cordyceps militaris CM01]|uniref:Uncharacterized protein n=1 Tax=Cordyceps militaris (strain CM01) TaxID=983644 RepID=G3J8T7_CORMM|nr:uncharacterized protein CCM_03091 [Cordyceps militaris CM01]EGX94820.1 hypothetical protein CCM_03091 [Cordyceps militaris CM01]